MNENLITSESLELLRSNKTFYMSTKRPLLGFNSSNKILKGLKKLNYTNGILYLQPFNSVSKEVPPGGTSNVKDFILSLSSYWLDRG
jgi:hypothetical protein